MVVVRWGGVWNSGCACGVGWNVELRWCVVEWCVVFLCPQRRGDSTMLKSLNDRSLVIDVRESHSGRACRGNPWVPKYSAIDAYSKGASGSSSWILRGERVMVTTVIESLSREVFMLVTDCSHSNMAARGFCWTHLGGGGW